MHNKIRLALSIFLASFLTGCLVPEKFNATVTVKQDETYTYKYEGTAVNALILMAIKQQGKISARDEESWRAETEKASKMDGVKKIKYLGNAKYDLSLDQTMKFGQTSQIISLVNVRKNKDGSVTLASSEIKKKDLDGIKQLGIKIDGSLDVILPKNAKVISHNATGTPGFFSKAYTWKIGLIEQHPTITFTVGN